MKAKKENKIKSGDPLSMSINETKMLDTDDSDHIISQNDSGLIINSEKQECFMPNQLFTAFLYLALNLME